MKARHLWISLLVVVMLVAAVFWAATRQPRHSPATLSKTNPAPAAAFSVTAPSSSETPASRKGKRKSKSANSSPWRPLVHKVAADGTAAVPARYQFDGVARVQTGRDFEEWLGHFQPEQQAVLREFDERFFGVYQNRNPDQIAWMAGNGYLMPEDVLAAESIATPQLRAMAEQGDAKAAFLLKDRDLREIARQMKTNNASYGDVLEANPRLNDDTFLLRDKILLADSPYRALMKARSSAVVDPALSKSREMRVIGALYWAMSLGDRGARQMLTDYIRSSPNYSVRQRRRSVSDGAAALYGYMTESQMLPGGAGRGCIEAIDPDDPYPVDSRPSQYN